MPHYYIYQVMNMININTIIFISLDITTIILLFLFVKYIYNKINF